MKKRILAAALAVAMVLACAITAFAVNETEEPEIIVDNLVIEGFNSARTNSVPLRDGETRTVKFHNKSNGTLNWENFILLVTGAETYSVEEEILFIRADNYAWGGVGPYYDPMNGQINISDDAGWAEWAEAARAGFDVELSISRTGDTLVYSAKMGEDRKYTVDLTATAKEPLPETVYVCLTGENCTLTAIGTEPEPEPEPEPEIIVDNLVIEGFGCGWSNIVPLRDGDTRTVKFHNQSNGTNNWDNFVLLVTSAEFYEGASEDEILFIRADNCAWGGGAGCYSTDFVNGQTNIADWDEWAAAARAGFDVELSISRTGDTLVYNAKMGEDGKYTVDFTATAINPLPETAYVCLTGENCTLTAIGTKPEPDPEIGEIVYKDGGSIDLTVTSFFNEKTAPVAMKSGEGYIFKFFNQSHGTNNWDNYILAVTGAVGEAYTGAAQEILIVRADNWGWGGDMSDFVAPGAAGNALVFDSDINFDNFAAMMQAGAAVELKIGRSGNTLVYEAKIGEYYSKLTATSGKALPEETYVFLTGENCVLSSEDPSSPWLPPVLTPTTPAQPADPDTPADLVEEVPAITGDLKVTSFFNEKTDAVALRSGGSYTFKFNNKSNGSNNWDNYILAVTGAVGEAYTGKEQEVLILRADSWGWGGGMSDFVAPDGTGNPLVFTNNITDWTVWSTASKVGIDTEITLSRKGNTLTYTATMGGYTVNLTATSGKALPDTLYVFLTGENVSLTGITTEGTVGDDPAEPVEPAEPTDPVEPIEPAEPVEENTRIEGDLNVTGYFVEKTDAVPLRNNGSYTFRFNNKSNGTNVWDNYILAVTTASDPSKNSADQEVLIIRADNWGWGGGKSDFVAPDGTGNALAFTTNVEDQAAWLAAVQAGADVEITLTRTGDTLVYEAAVGEFTSSLTATSGKALPETLYVFLTGEKVSLTGITTEGTPGDAPTTAPTEPTEPTEPTDPTDPTEPTEPAEPIAPAEPDEPETVMPKIEGDLTVTNFFNEKTNAVPLRSGESYTFRFNNKTYGTNNWENFILAITGATGAAYTGADQEILIIRADNWGWGGGMSDFVAPDAAEGNKLAFESNIVWENWVALMQAGADVEITVSRDGDTLTYDATIGEYYVKLTATSGKALPTTAYVFLTGENCVLSNIQTVSAPVYTTPKTGDNSNIGMWIALMILSAIGLAVIVVKATPIFSRKK